MSRLRKPLLIILLLLAAGLLAISTLGQPQRFRAQLEQLASDAIGKPVRLAGPIDWSLEQGPGLRARQVSLLNPAWASGKAFAEAAELRLSLSWEQLLRGRINIASLQLKQLHIALERSADDNNWQFNRSGGDAKGGGFDPQLLLNGLDISYRNADAKVSHYALPELTLSAAAGQPLQLRTRLPNTLATPLANAALQLQGPKLTALLTDPLHWGLFGDLDVQHRKLQAALKLDLSTERPTINGTLALTAAPAANGSTAKAETGSAPIKHSPAPPSAQTLTALLNVADLQLQLSGDTPVWQGKATLSLTAGLLKLQTEDGPQGSVLHAQIDARKAVPSLQLKAAAGPVDVEALAKLGGFDAGLPMTAEKLTMKLQSSGDTAAALLANLRGDIELQQLNEIQDLMDLHPQTVICKQDDAGIAINISGQWAGQHFKIKTRGDSLQKLLDKQQPYKVDHHLFYGDNSQHFTGEVLRGDDGRTLKGELKLSGRDPSQFNRLLSSTALGELPKGLKYSISSSVNNPGDHLILDRIRADIAGNRIRGKLKYSLQADGLPPMLSGQLSTPKLTLSSLAGSKGQSKTKPTPWHDHPLPALPNTLQTDIKLSIGELHDGGSTLTKLRTTVTLKGDRLKLSPLTLHIADTPVTANFSYQYNQAKASASAVLDLDSPGFERLFPLGNFHPGSRLIIRGSKGHTRLRTHGSHLGQWQDNLELSNRLATLSATVVDAEQHTLSHAVLNKPHISRAPGKPFLFRGKGRYDGMPLTINGQSTVSHGGKLPPFRLQANAGDMDLKINGRLSAEQQLEVKQLQFELRAEHEQSLPLLLRSPLALKGPYLFAATLSSNGKHYQVNDLKVLAGGNDIGGRIGIDLAAKPHKLTLVLHSKRLIPTLKPVPDTTAGAPNSANDGHVSGHLIPNVHLLPQVPQGWDADYQVAVNELILGDNRIDRFQLKGKLRKQHLSLDPIRGRLNNSGSIAAKIDARIIKHHLHAQLSAQLKHLDLGFMLTRDDLNKPIPWYTDIELKLKGKGDYLPTFLASADGGVRFLGGHMDVDTSAMELWTLDMMGIAMPGLLKKKDEQGILCSVAGFRINDGIMTSEGMLFDTDQAFITGSGTINLHNEKLDLLLSPKKKRLSLFSIATPVVLGGTLVDPKASVPPREMALTAGSLALKVIQPWTLAGELLAAGLDRDSSCLKTLSDMRGKDAGKDSGKHSSESPIGGVLKQLGSDAGRFLE